MIVLEIALYCVSITAVFIAIMSAILALLQKCKIIQLIPSSAHYANKVTIIASPIMALLGTLAWHFFAMSILNDTHSHIIQNGFTHHTDTALPPNILPLVIASTILGVFFTYIGSYIKARCTLRIPVVIFVPVIFFITSFIAWHLPEHGQFLIYGFDSSLKPLAYIWYMLIGAFTGHPLT